MRPYHVLSSLLLLGFASASWESVYETAKAMYNCPMDFARCIIDKDCVQIMECVGNCMVPEVKQLNLTCYVPCTFQRDTTKWDEFSMCIGKKTPPDQPTVIDLPHGGICPSVQSLAVPTFTMSQLEGQWFLVAGASDLEGFDCQANRVSKHNDTAWIIDEYYQGEITGMGFKWGQSRQMIRPSGPGTMEWRPEEGASGYEADYVVLATGESHVILTYCAPLPPSMFGWSSIIAYSRTAVLEPAVEAEMRAFMQQLDWDYPLLRVNHQDCHYKIGPTDADASAPTSAE